MLGLGFVLALGIKTLGNAHARRCIRVCVSVRVCVRVRVRVCVSVRVRVRLGLG